MDPAFYLYTKETSHGRYLTGTIFLLKSHPLSRAIDMLRICCSEYSRSGSCFLIVEGV
jgi:hypothetical protein